MLRSAWAKPLGFALLAVVVALLVSGSRCDSNSPTSDFVFTPTAAATAAPTVTRIPSTPTPEFTRAPTVTPTPSLTFNYLIYAGNYLIAADKTQDTGCNFNQSFNGTLTVTVNPDGSNFRVQIVELATRVYTGTIQQNGIFSTSGTNTFFGFTATGTVTGQLASGFKASGTETLNLTQGCPPPNDLTHQQMVIYIIRAFFP